MSDLYNDPFSVCFNIMKIRYKDYDESLSSLNILQEHDGVNVFINMETIFKHLSMVQDLEKKLILRRDFTTILISNILNLAAHYKRFFVNNGFDTRVYLYHTDFHSTEFQQFKYNEEFRSYYLMKYNDNPKFVYLTDAFKQKILPDVKTYCEFIPRVYYLSSLNVDGSLIPYIIGQEDTKRKNCIITGDFCDMQYSLLPNYICHFLHKGIGFNSVCNSVLSSLADIMKKRKEDVKPLSETFETYSMFCSLLSVLGDRYRSIAGLNGVGPRILQKYIKEGIEQKIIQPSTTNPSMIGSIFKDNEMAEEFVNNYYCLSVKDMYDELEYSEKISILNQRKDRYDLNTLISLNNTVFTNYPLILESLTL